MADYDFAPRVCSRAYNCAKGILVFLPHPSPDIFITGIFLLFLFWYISTIPHLVYFHYSWITRPGDASVREMRLSGRCVRPGDTSVRVMRPSDAPERCAWRFVRVTRVMRPSSSG